MWSFPYTVSKWPKKEDNKIGKIGMGKGTNVNGSPGESLEERGAAAE